MNLHFKPTNGEMPLTANQKFQIKLWLEKNEGRRCVLSLDLESPETRSDQQNRALHKWCEQIAEEYSEKGITIPQIINKFTMEIIPTKDNVKEIIVKTAVERMFNKKSTKNLLKQGEIDKLVDVVTKFNSQFEIDYIPWPSNCEKCDAYPCICS